MTEVYVILKLEDKEIKLKLEEAQELYFKLEKFFKKENSQPYPRCSRPIDPYYIPIITSTTVNIKED